jgi:catechol 2,3-dioxygenase-like lactoylglutathione lyase family enzyme
VSISHIHAATIYVNDQDRAVDFYKNKLGFDVRTDMPFGPDYRWIEVAPPGAQTGIILAYKFGEWPERVGKSAGMVLDIPNMKETYKELSDRGVKFIEPPVEQAWGIQAIVEDPDGNSLVLVGR